MTARLVGKQNGIVVLDEPCEWCAVWIGPHVHMLRDDGSLGTLVLGLHVPWAVTPQKQKRTSDA